MSPAELLFAAADRVQFQGWCQGSYAKDTKGDSAHPGAAMARQWCMAGALEAQMLTGSVENWQVAFDALANEVGVISAWNDVPGRTVGEVADIMRRVAKELENSAQ